MSLVGSLEDLGLGDILQIVSLSRKSGVLNLAWGEVKGKIIFKDGQVVTAVSSDLEKSLPTLLSERNMITVAEKAKAAKAISSVEGASRIIETLASDFRLEAGELEKAMQEQIETVVFHFFSWPEGSFNFELQEIDEELAELSPEQRAFVLDVGLSPQFLAMEGTRLQDERKREKAEAPVGPPRAKREGEPAPPPAASAETEHDTEEIDLGDSSQFVEESHEKPAPPSPPEPEHEADFSSVADAVKYYESMGASSKTEAAPAVSEPEPEPEPTPEKPAPAPEAPADGPGLLVVDDERIVIESLSHYFVPKGYSVRGFGSVASARSGLEGMVDTGERPYAAVVDLLMPDSRDSSTLGGLELLEMIRETNPAIPVFMMSDYENKIAREKAQELGARFFFMKPKTSQLDESFDSPELVNFVEVLDSALKAAFEKPPAPEPAAARTEAPAPIEGVINLGEELRREFGEEAQAPREEEQPTSRGLHMLKTMISELNDPSSSGQITLMILRFAAEMMNRAVIFLVAKNQIAGLGQFGINLDGIDAQKHVRQIRIPLNQPSIFREAIQKRMPIKKTLKHNKWNDYLVEHLGGHMPNEVFVAPIIAGGKIPAILYGDNAPEELEIGDTESLEIFLAQAGLAMEKALLERRLMEMGSDRASG